MATDHSERATSSSAARSMRPYARRYHVSEWGWHLSWDGKGPVVQFNLGRTGITVPIPEREDRRVRLDT